jgi:hypothetical protein
MEGTCSEVVCTVSVRALLDDAQFVALEAAAAAVVADGGAAGRLSIAPMRGDDGGVFGALVCAGLDEFAVGDLDDAHGCSPAVVSVLARRLPPGEGQVGRAAPLVLHRCGLH